jgi:hypothetical protein
VSRVPACLFIFSNFRAKEFQSLTSESDADANEDEHIKALYADVDINKDGKVRCVFDFACASTCVFVNSVHQPSRTQPPFFVPPMHHRVTHKNAGEL